MNFIFHLKDTSTEYASGIAVVEADSAELARLAVEEELAKINPAEGEEPAYAVYSTVVIDDNWPVETREPLQVLVEMTYL